MCVPAPTHGGIWSFVWSATDSHAALPSQIGLIGSLEDSPPYTPGAQLRQERARLDRRRQPSHARIGDKALAQPHRTDRCYSSAGNRWSVHRAQNLHAASTVTTPTELDTEPARSALSRRPSEHRKP